MTEVLRLPLQAQRPPEKPRKVNMQSAVAAPSAAPLERTLVGENSGRATHSLKSGDSGK